MELRGTTGAVEGGGDPLEASRKLLRAFYGLISSVWQHIMRQLSVCRPARGRRYEIWGWLAAIIACSCIFVAATGAARTPAEDCVRTMPHLGAWWAIFLLAMPSLPAGIVYAICRGKVRQKRRLADMAPSLSIIFLVYALAIAYAAGWWGACDAPVLASIAALTSYGAALSSAVFGAYWAAYYTRDQGRLRYMLVPFSVMTTTALAYNILKTSDGWGPQDIGATLQFFATIAAIAVAVAAAMFDAEYSKSRRQKSGWGWTLPIILIAIGILAYFITPGSDGWPDGNGDDIQIHVVQTVWAGVAVTGGMLTTRATESPTKSPWLWASPPIMLIFLVVVYPGISSEWECLNSIDQCADPGPIVRMYTLVGHIDEHGAFRPWILVTILLSLWNAMMAMAVAMLGVAMASRVRPESIS